MAGTTPPIPSPPSYPRACSRPSARFYGGFLELHRGFRVRYGGGRHDRQRHGSYRARQRESASRRPTGSNYLESDYLDARLAHQFVSRAYGRLWWRGCRSRRIQSAHSSWLVKTGPLYLSLTGDRHGGSDPGNGYHHLDRERSKAAQSRSLVSATPADFRGELQPRARHQ